MPGSDELLDAGLVVVGLVEEAVIELVEAVVTVRLAVVLAVGAVH